MAGQTSSRLRGWAILALVMLCVAAISIIGTLIWSWSRTYDRGAAPLTSGLPPKDAKTASAAFDARLGTRFPLGSSESVMTDELRREGFAQQDWGGAAGTEHLALRDEGGVTCRLHARIWWRATADGRLSAIRGEYGAGTCL